MQKMWPELHRHQQRSVQGPRVINKEHTIRVQQIPDKLNNYQVLKMDLIPLSQLRPRC